MFLKLFLITNFILVTLVLGQGIFEEPELAHRFSYNGDPRSNSFTEHIAQTKRPKEFYYLLTGDTQYWFRCTPDNIQCYIATGCDGTTKECQVLQGNHANLIQEISLRALITQMTAENARPKAMIINGDLTNYGHKEELDEYEKHWQTRLEGIRLYPGLGNHDYANNVDDCTLNHCAHRMLNWFRKFVERKLRKPMDLKKNRAFMNMQYTGSLAYSWDECSNFDSNGRLLPENERKCVHFVQLNNYPTYERYVEYLIADWNIESSLGWLEQDLRRNLGKPVIINFHDFDHGFSMEDKERFRHVVDKPEFQIVAIFFAHMHSKVGLHPLGYTCLNHKRVPLIYSGSVPANNYMLMRLNPESSRTIEGLYEFHVDSAQRTKVLETVFNNRAPC